MDSIINVKFISEMEDKVILWHFLSFLKKKLGFFLIWKSRQYIKHIWRIGEMIKDIVSYIYHVEIL